MAATLGVGTGVGVVVAQRADSPPPTVTAASPGQGIKPTAEVVRDDQAATVAMLGALKEIDTRIERLEAAAQQADDIRAEIKVQSENIRKLTADIDRLDPESLERRELRQFLAALKAHVEVTGPRQRYDAALRQYHDAPRSPGTKPDDPALMDLHAAVVIRRLDLIMAYETAIARVGAAQPLPPQVQGKVRWVAEQLATEPVEPSLIDLAEEERSQMRLKSVQKLRSVFVKNLREVSTSPGELACLRDIRNQLWRELELRKLQAQGVTLPEPTRGADANVADKLDQVLRELAALRGGGPGGDGEVTDGYSVAFPGAVFGPKGWESSARGGAPG